MLLTGSTIKDSLPNAKFFVAANLASGVDHMVVFLDAPRDVGQSEVATFLAAHPSVTLIETGRDWWQGDRPHSLNVRQQVNVNWLCHVLEPLAWAQWLFHVDGDEVARLDSAALATVPADVNAVWLPPLEAVSELQPLARPTQFKRLLDDDELNLLQVLGLLDEASNQAYFHGHVMGKSGVRPSSGSRLSLHHAISAEGHRLVPHEDARLAVLHYDAVSGAEFVRKWQRLAKAGPTRYRASRAPMARAATTLIEKSLSESVRDRYLHQIYDRTTRDDVATLAELGLLVEVDPEQGEQPPQTMSATRGAELAARVDALRSERKRGYLVQERPGPPPGLRTDGRGPTRRVRGLLRGSWSSDGHP